MEYVSTKALIDLGIIPSLLCAVNGHQIFIDGSFNGDCHPGNYR